MRIAFDAKRAYRNHSGLGNYSRGLISGLVRDFPQEGYYLLSPKGPAEGIHFPPTGGQVHEVRPTRWQDRLFPSLWRLKGMVRDLQNHEIDLYHGLSHELPLGIQNLPIKRVVTMHDLIFKRFPEYYKATDVRIYDRKYRHALTHADRIIAISEQTREDLQSFYQVPEQKIKVIYQGIHPRYFSPSGEEKVARLREEKSLPPSFLLTVGAGNPRKNISVLLQALKSFVPDARPLLVWATRESSFLQKVRKEINKEGLSDWVRVLTDISDEQLAVLYEAASLLVFPSLFEGFGLPVGEALAKGTPVVTSKGTCFEEVGGEGALYLDPAHPREWASAIQAVLTKRELSERLSGEGQKFVQKFATQDHAAQVHALYQDLIEG